MKPQHPDPRRLDPQAFARQNGVLQADFAVRSFRRLVDDAHPERLPAEDERLLAVFSGGLDMAPRGAERPWLRVQGQCRLALVCQRCLQPVDVALVVERRFVFAADEDQAAALDAELDDDVLALEPQIDAVALLEDELVLSLPLVPMHDVCPEPLLPPPVAEGAADAQVEVETTHPFASLASLKRRPGPADDLP